MLRDELFKSLTPKLPKTGERDGAIVRAQAQAGRYVVQSPGGAVKYGVRGPEELTNRSFVSVAHFSGVVTVINAPGKAVPESTVTEITV